MDTKTEITTLDYFENSINAIAFNEKLSILVVGSQKNMIKYIKMEKLG